MKDELGMVHVGFTVLTKLCQLYEDMFNPLPDIMLT